MFGAGFSGANFSDTKTGAITGTVGSIKVGTDNLSLGFSNLLPGEPQSVTTSYQNTGTSPEDVWIVFTDKDALHALNDLGGYGSVSIVDAQGGVNWFSQNLTDFYPEGTPGANGGPATYYVPEKMLLQTNVASGATGSFTFTFAYTSKLTGTGGGVWNSYPLATETHNGVTYTPPSGVALGSKNGLPYEIVSTQVGQQP
jgi:hypothetical protein